MKLLAAALGAALLISLSSCQDSALLDAASAASPSIVVSWALPADGNRGASAVSPVSYRVTLTSSAGVVTTQQGLVGQSATFTNPQTGVYTVKVQGLDSSNTVLLEGVGSVDFSSTKAAVNLVLSSVVSESATGQMTVNVVTSALGFSGSPTLSLTVVDPSGEVLHPLSSSIIGGFVWSEPSATLGHWAVFALLSNGTQTAAQQISFDVTATSPSIVTLTFGTTDLVTAPVSVSAVSLLPSAIQLWSGSSQTIVPTLVPSAPSDSLLAWTSDDPAVAVVSQLGVVTAVAPGSTTVHVVSADRPAISASCRVDVGYQLKYDANRGQGSVPVDSQIYLPGTTAAVSPGTGLSLANSILAGWTTDPAESGESASYATDGTARVKFNKQNVTLYAIWVSSAFKVSASGTTVALTGYTAAPPANWSVPPGVTTLGDSAFTNCNNLVTVSLPSSVVSLGKNALGGGASMTSILVNPDNPAFQSVDGVLFDKAKTTLIQAPGALANNYFVPDGVTTIGPYAFFDCAKLTKITFPESLQVIGAWAFFVSGLTSLTLPPGVVTIEANSFAGSTALAAVSLSQSLKTIGGNAFANCLALTSVTIPESVTSLGSYAFGGCSNLLQVVLVSPMPPSVLSDTFEAETAKFVIHVPSATAITSYLADTGWSAYANLIVSP